jgi:membrane protein
VDRLNRLIAQAKLAVERARARYALVDVVVGTFKRYSEDEGGQRAAALTYYIFFSIFPLVLFAVSALGYVAFLDESTKNELIKAGVDAFPMLRDVLNPKGLEQIVANRGSLVGVGTILALYSGTGVILALEHSLNKIYRVTKEGSFIQKRLASMKWLATLGLAAVVSVAAGTVAKVSQDLFGIGHAAAVGVSIALVIVGFALNLLIFLAAFKFLPAKDLSWRDVWPGAVVGAVAFEVLKYVGAAYLERGSHARAATFGAFATAAALLVTAYLLSQIILLSAEVNAVLEERRLTRQSIAST